MKILHIMNWFWEGVGYQENHLPFQQTRFGNKVQLICSKDYPNYRKFVKDKNRDVNYDYQTLTIKRLDSLSIRSVTEQNWFLGLQKEINNFAPDIVHLHHIWDLPTIQFLLFSFRDKKIKVFVDSHIDNGNFDCKKFYKRTYYFGFIKKVIVPLMLKRGFTFIAVNPYAQYCLNSYFGIPQDKIKLLLLGVDDEKIFFSREARKQIREKYNIDEKNLVFAFSGVFERSKSLFDLINAFKILAKKYPHISLLMIGQGILPKDEEFQSLQKKGRIILSGWQLKDELYRWYSVADIGVMPGKLGGIRDILAVGRPVIISDDLAVSYLLENNNGLVFRRGNILELAQSMEQYIKNPYLIQEYGRRSLQLTNQKLSWRNIARESLQIYGELR